MTSTDLAADMRAMGDAARSAARAMATADGAAKERALRTAAAEIRNRTADILAANAEDMAFAQKEGRWDPLESTCRHASLSIL